MSVRLIHDKKQNPLKNMAKCKFCDDAHHAKCQRFFRHLEAAPFLAKQELTAPPALSPRCLSANWRRMADVSASGRDFLLHPLQGAQIAGKSGTRQALNGRLKSKGFNLEDTHMGAPAQIDR